MDTCEHRCIPPRDLELDLTRKRNLLLGNTKSENKNDQTPKSDNKENKDPVKSPGRRLFDMLIAPVEDILMKLEANSSLVIIPDKNLHYCPFGILQDWYGRNLHDRFHITYLPSILAMEKVIHNELNHLRASDDLNFDRNQAKKGGMNKLLAYVMPITPTSCTVQESVEKTEGQIDLRKVSNPRLVTSSQRTQSAMNKAALLSKDNTSLSENNMNMKALLSPRQSSQILPGIPEYPGAPNSKGLKQFPVPMDTGPQVLPPVGQPVPPEKMLSLNSYSTLTTHTATGTDITTSALCVTNYKQVSCQDKCLVIGNPSLPER